MPTVEQAISTAQAVIEQRLKATWIDGLSQLLTPIQWPNIEGLETQTGFVDLPPQNAPWLKVDYDWGEAIPATLGPGGDNLVLPTLQLAIYIPHNTGSNQKNALVGKARAIFSRFFGSGLDFDPVSGPVEIVEGAWLVCVLTARFRFFETVV